MNRLLNFLRCSAQIFRSRYVRGLECEVARLRAENRALVNSLLGTAGVPPLEISDAGKGTDGSARVALPAVRRRSWQQVGRILEIEAARRNRERAASLSATHGSPAPRANH